MSKDEAIKLAIEVFKSATPKYTRQRKDQKTLGGALDYWRLEQHQKMKAIKALEEALANEEIETLKHCLFQMQEAAKDLVQQAQALAKQEQGEPVAYIHRNEYNEYRLEPHDDFDIKSIPFNVDVPLYTTPQQRKPLTDDEIAEVAERMEASDPTDSFWRDFARSVEAAHDIKE